MISISGSNYVMVNQFLMFPAAAAAAAVPMPAGQQSNAAHFLDNNNWCLGKSQATLKSGLTGCSGALAFGDYHFSPVRVTVDGNNRRTQVRVTTLTPKLA